MNKNIKELTELQAREILAYIHPNKTEIIERVENADLSQEEELVNDLMMLMASFSGKLYGKRSADRRKKKKEESLLKL